MSAMTQIWTRLIMPTFMPITAMLCAHPYQIHITELCWSVHKMYNILIQTNLFYEKWANLFLNFDI